MHHVAAFYESIDPGGALTPINSVPEQQYFTAGDDFRVPKDLAFLIGEIALTAAASLTRAQVQSPTLRMTANVDIEPVVGAVTFGSPPECLYHPEAPIQLTPEESLNIAVNSNPAAAEAHYGLVFLSDGPVQPVTGNMFSLRATATIAQAVGVWTNGNLTFDQTLPAGRYAVVGLRARSTDGVAARLVFPEQQARPGVAVVNALADNDPYWARFGRLGVWGEFPHTNPPTLDILGGAAAAQTVILDLIRVS